MPRKTLLGVLILLTIIGLLVWCAIGASPRGSPEVASYVTSAWAGRSGQEFMMRAERDGEKVLLFRCLNWEESIWRDNPDDPRRTRNLPPIEAVYRLDPTTRELTIVTVADWETAQGAIVDLETLERASGGRLTYDHQRHVLVFDGAGISTAGKAVLAAQASPDGEKMAVYSKGGKYRKPMLHFLLGGGGAHGQSFHELFRTSDGTSVGKPLAIPYPYGGSALIPWWSADGGYVVYHNPEFTRLFVVSIDQKEISP